MLSNKNQQKIRNKSQNTAIPNPAIYSRPCWCYHQQEPAKGFLDFFIHDFGI